MLATNGRGGVGGGVRWAGVWCGGVGVWWGGVGWGGVGWLGGVRTVGTTIEF